MEQPSFVDPMEHYDRHAYDENGEMYYYGEHGERLSLTKKRESDSSFNYSDQDNEGTKC